MPCRLTSFSLYFTSPSLPPLSSPSPLSLTNAVSQVRSVTHTRYRPLFQPIVRVFDHSPRWPHSLASQRKREIRQEEESSCCAFTFRVSLLLLRLLISRVLSESYLNKLDILVIGFSKMSDYFVNNREAEAYLIGGTLIVRDLLSLSLFKALSFAVQRIFGFPSTFRLGLAGWRGSSFPILSHQSE